MNIRQPSLALAGVFLTLFCGPTIASPYECVASDATYHVGFDERDRDIAHVSTSFAPPLDHKQMEFALTARPTGSGLRYANDFAELRGKGDDLVLTIDGRQIPCRPSQAGVDEPVAGLAYGRSLGGRMRAGPGLHHPVTDSLPEGMPLAILRNTGVRHDGYDWFEVSLGDRTGFQWGGILCSEDLHLAGVFKQCGTRPQDAAAAPMHGGWMAFAVDMRGAVGHGWAATRAEAEDLAMRYCGNASCAPVALTQQRCQALADGSRGPYVYAVGEGRDLRTAETRALQDCTASAGQCRISYSFCK